MESSRRKHVPAHQRAAQKTEHQDQRHCPRQCGGEHPLGEVAVMHILGDQKIEIPRRGRQREDPAAGAAGILNAVQPPLIVEFDKIARIGRDGGQESRLPANTRCRASARI